ncbi:MAG: AEC family transporter [Candidatus Delongbacteria bacterium]|jgi:predicted permease|nr:AEC family transporter [Candidatus Delongbacteria bacterium]
MHNQIIINQITILGILALIGYITAKLKFFPDGFSLGLNKLVIKVTLPLMIFTSLSKFDFSIEILKSSFFVMIFAYTSMFLLLLFGTISAKLMKLESHAYTIHRIHTTFGNIAFLGYPLLDSLFPGGKGLLFAVVYHIVLSSMLWTVGVMLFNKNRKIKLTESLKHLINPNTIAFALGITAFLIKLELPYILDKTFSGLGGTTIYLSMIYIGMMLSRISIKGTFKELQIYVLSVNKMLIVPFILLLIINFTESLFGYEMDVIAKSVVVLQTAMPCMAMIVIIATEFGSDDELAAKNVFLTTLFSIVTLPVVYWFIGWV